MSQNNLFDDLQQDSTTKHSEPVTCLGQTCVSDEERRKHFTVLLREKLKDPEFRKIEGFPHGETEDILNLSDPPYYTACPNPWLASFIAEWEAQKLAQPEGYHYHREPFAADVSEGKNHPIYNAHSYHTNVPHKAIMRYILHYTNPGDIVFDGFKKCWQDRDYATIVTVADKIPNNVLEEDPKLLMWYDQAVTRLGAD